MKIGKVKLYPLSVVAQLVVLYLIATGMTGWYIYALLAFIFVERAFLQFALWMLAKVQREVAKQMQEKLTQILADAQAQGMAATKPTEDTDD